ncbi:hypothetical protein Lal_00021950 [Lupinus albus]|nr:hypothetical protein Lal_00021950 [Lupinus albus]
MGRFSLICLFFRYTLQRIVLKTEPVGTYLNPTRIKRGKPDVIRFGFYPSSNFGFGFGFGIVNTLPRTHLGMATERVRVGFMLTQPRTRIERGWK